MSNDRAERSALRVVLTEACGEADKRQGRLLKQVRDAARQGTYDAFK